MKFQWIFHLIFLIAVFIIETGFAGGSNYSYVQGSKTLSLGGLYIAGSDGASNILSNPAGLGYLTGREININIIDVIGEQQFNNLPRSDFHSYRKDNINLNGGAYWALSDGFTIGLGYNRLLDYNIDWPFVMYRQTDSASAVMGFEFSNSIIINSISPAAAVRLGNFAFGVAVNIYEVKQKTAFPQGSDKWLQNIGEAAYQFNYDLDGWSFGFELGFIGEISSDLKIGGMVRNGFKTDLSGQAKSDMFTDLDSTETQVDVSSKYEMPWVFGFGALYNLNDNIKINIDGLYSLWSSTQKNMSFDFTNSIWQNNLTTVDSVSGINAGSFNLNYKNTITAGVGVEIIPGGEISYRLGYRFSSSPNSENTYTMLFPTLDQHWFSFGIGYINEDISADLNITYGIGTSKEIKNNFSSLSGEYKSDILIPSITLRYQF